MRISQWSPLIQSGLIIDQTCMTSVCGWSMGVTQARKFQNYTPQNNLGAKIKRYFFIGCECITEIIDYQLMFQLRQKSKVIF